MANGYKKQYKVMKLYPETKTKLQDIAKEASKVQGQNVSFPELQRRISNIPNLKDVLLKDAEKKRKVNGI